MKRNWITKLIGGLSFTSVMFVFQACYGTPQDFGLDVLIEGQVKSRATGAPVKGIKVSVAETVQYEFTNDEGKFSFYTETNDTFKIRFEDVDFSQYGTFVNKDTLLTKADVKDYTFYLSVFLDQK